MSIYPASAEKATCPVAGCGCAQRAPRYPSDMTDAEWEVLGPAARAVMAELRHGPGGRPMAHRLRVVVDAIRYLVRYGVEWRALPADFPPWQTVRWWWDRFRREGTWERATRALTPAARAAGDTASTRSCSSTTLPWSLHQLGLKTSSGSWGSDRPIHKRMSLQERRSERQTKREEQRRIALRPPALDEVDVHAAGCRTQRQAQRRRRRVLARRQRAHQEEQRFAALRRQVQAAQAFAAHLVVPLMPRPEQQRPATAAF